jgi:hypothetical protein
MFDALCREHGGGDLKQPCPNYTFRGVFKPGYERLKLILN